MHKGLAAVPDSSSPRATFRGNSATAEAVRTLIKEGLKSGGIRRRARVLANSIDELGKAEKWLYDQNEGHTTLTVTALVELAMECPDAVIEDVIAEMFPRSGGSPAAMLAGVASITRAFARVQVSVSEGLADGRLNVRDLMAIHQAVAALLVPINQTLQLSPRACEEPTA